MKSLQKKEGTVELAEGNAKFSFPNVKTDTDVFVSQTIYDDTENPMAAIDENSTAAMDAEVFTTDDAGDVSSLVVKNHP